MKIVKPGTKTQVKIFLAGTIDMGNAVDWQKEISDALDNYNVEIWNPLNDVWDNSIAQSMDDPRFCKQVKWELQHIEEASYVIFFIAPTSKSPVSLLELGLCAAMKPQKTVVCCPDGFYRKGNVDIVCQRYGIPTIDSIDDLIEYLKCWIKLQYHD